MLRFDTKQSVESMQSVWRRKEGYGGEDLKQWGGDGIMEY